MSTQSNSCREPCGDLHLDKTGSTPAGSTRHGYGESSRRRFTPSEAIPVPGQSFSLLPHPRLAEFDTALHELTGPQRRVLRLMLTGARVALVAGAAGEQRRSLDRWLGGEHVYLSALRAVQRDLGPTARARLHAYITRELIWENDEGLDAEAWATLAVVRALGRLDAETNLLEESLLRTEMWSTDRP